MSIRVDAHRLKVFEKEFESRYGVPPGLFLVEIGRPFPRTISFYGWVPQALRDMAEFCEKEKAGIDHDAALNAAMTTKGCVEEDLQATRDLFAWDPTDEERRAFRRGYLAGATRAFERRRRD